LVFTTALFDDISTSHSFEINYLQAQKIAKTAFPAANPRSRARVFNAIYRHFLPGLFSAFSTVLSIISRLFHVELAAAEESKRSARG
jgi:hypothetical protein